MIAEEVLLFGLGVDGVFHLSLSGVKEFEFGFAEGSLVSFFQDGGKHLGGVEGVIVGEVEILAKADVSDEFVELGLGKAAGAVGGEGVVELMERVGLVGQDDLLEGEDATGVGDASQFREEGGLVGVGDVVEGGVPGDEVDGGGGDGRHIPPIAGEDRFVAAVFDLLSELRGLQHGRAAVDPEDVAALAQSQIGQFRGGPEDQEDGGALEGGGQGGEALLDDLQFRFGGGKVWGLSGQQDSVGLKFPFVRLLHRFDGVSVASAQR